MPDPGTTGTSGLPETGDPPVASWQDEGFVRQWLAGDEHKTMLDFPRRLTTAVIAQEEQDPSVVIDIASGPGTYLGVLLEAFPHARGIWTDASTAMLDAARTQLEPYGDRVEFRLLDMRELDSADDLPAADAIVTSRAAHHLPYEELLAFYRACERKLAPGGWVANLDHTEPPAEWDARYRAIRKRNQEPAKSPQLPRHRHDQPRPTMSDHIETMTGAGLTEAELVWKAFHTCLFMARKP